MKPYENESESLQIADLTIENRTDRISIYGSLDITRDKQGLKAAKELKNILDAALKTLEAEEKNGKLPDAVATEATVTINNPF